MIRVLNIQKRGEIQTVIDFRRKNCRRMARHFDSDNGRVTKAEQIISTGHKMPSVAKNHK